MHTEIIKDAISGKGETLCIPEIIKDAISGKGETSCIQRL